MDILLDFFSGTFIACRFSVIHLCLSTSESFSSLRYAHTHPPSFASSSSSFASILMVLDFLSSVILVRFFLDFLLNKTKFCSKFLFLSVLCVCVCCCWDMLVCWNGPRLLDFLIFPIILRFFLGIFFLFYSFLSLAYVCFLLP